MQATLEALNSTHLTPIHETAREERDSRVRHDAANYIKGNELDMNAIIEMLAKTDPIINYVWDHYTVKKLTTPINPNDVKYFWEKVSECTANIGDMPKVKKIINPNKKD